jgi:hypothetical protein
MSRSAVTPYLIHKDEDGTFRLTVRTTRFNSQGYPLVSSELLGDVFKTATAARTYAKTEFKALPADISTK